MNVYCLEDFKSEVEQLRRKNAYRNLEVDLIKCFFDVKVQSLMTGARLNNSDTTPYIKRRINGSSGYRVYYLLIVKDENVYLIYVHPKTGPLGSPNITNEAKAEFYKDALMAIKTNDLYTVNPSADKKNLTFKKNAKR